jgi:hypothetical protein
MELVVFVGCLIVLDILALRFGFDSRDGIASDQAERRTSWFDDADQRRRHLALHLTTPVPHTPAMRYLGPEPRATPVRRPAHADS